MISEKRFTVLAICLSTATSAHSEFAPSVLLSSLHPVSRTGYGGQVQLLVAQLQSRNWHVQLLAWNLRHRGEGPCKDLEALLSRKGLRAEALSHAGGDPRALLPGVPIVTSRVAPPTGYEDGLGWLEITRAIELFSSESQKCTAKGLLCSFRKPDVLLHLHDAWWLGPPPTDVRNACLPPMVAWLPILFDPLLSDDPERPDRSGAALEMFSGVIAMSLWGRGVYERALASLAVSTVTGTQRGQVLARWLPPLLGHIPHALNPAFGEGPLAFESQSRKELRQSFGIPMNAFVVLLVGRNPPPPSSEANRKSHRAAIRAFARFKARLSQICTSPCVSTAHLHVHSDLHGAVDIPSLLREAGLSVERQGGASSSQENLSPEMLRNLYSASDVLLQLSRAEGFGLPVLEAQACGTPVVVNGATAMAENVLLGRVLLPTPRQSPSGGRSDRPGSWTPPDGAAAVEALLEIWGSPPTAAERNRVRVALAAAFSPWHVAEQMIQVLQPFLNKHSELPAVPSTTVSESAEQRTYQEQWKRSSFCEVEFRQAESCWRSKPGNTQSTPCKVVEDALRKCFSREWEQPSFAHGFAEPINRLVPTRHGWPMLYNIFDIAVGRTLEICGEWLPHERRIYEKLDLNRPNVRVLEAGANVGAVTIPLAMQLQHGRVLALEPNRMNLQLLNANLALAQLYNVDTFHAALGQHQGALPEKKDSAEANGGSQVSFGDSRQFQPESRQVKVVTVDQLLAQVDRLDFWRLGAGASGGFGVMVAMLGAMKSIERFRPWVLLELTFPSLDFQDDGDGASELEIQGILHSKQYDCSLSKGSFLSISTQQWYIPDRARSKCALAGIHRERARCVYESCHVI